MPAEQKKSHFKKAFLIILLGVIILGGLWIFSRLQRSDSVAPLLAQPETIVERPPEETIEQTAPVFQIADIPILKSVVAVEVETKALVASQLKEYALKLHDDLLTNSNCLDTWQALQTEPFPVALLIQLEPYCWDSAPMNSIYQSFIQGAQISPKKALTKETQGVWARIKTALWPFHRISAPDEDFVEQALLALEQKDIALATHFIKQLDNNEQQAFKDFFIKVRLYEQAQKNLDTYLLSF